MKIPQTDIWLVLPCVHLLRPLISIFYLDSFIVLFDFMSIESQLGVLRIVTLPCPFTGTEFILEPQPSSWTIVTSGVHILYLRFCVFETSNSIFSLKILSVSFSSFWDWEQMPLCLTVIHSSKFVVLEAGAQGASNETVEHWKEPHVKWLVRSFGHTTFGKHSDNSGGIPVISHELLKIWGLQPPPLPGFLFYCRILISAPSVMWPTQVPSTEDTDTDLILLVLEEMLSFGCFAVVKINVNQ